MKISVKILSVIFAMILLFTAIPFSASARSIADIDAEIAERNEKIEANNDKIEKTEDQIKLLQEQNRAYDEKIEVLEEQIAPLRKKINELNDQIKTLETEIDELNTRIGEINVEVEDQNKQIDETYEVLKKRLRATYMAGETSELEIFLNATDFQDFLTRTELVRQISKHDTNIVKNLEEQIGELNTLLQELTEKSTKLDENRVQLDSDRKVVQQEKAVFDAQKAELESVVNKNEANITKQNQLISSLNANSALQEKLIAQAQKEKEEESKNIDKEVSNSGSVGDGTVDNGTTNHGFKLSSKNIISPIQESGAHYSRNFATHSAQGTASVDIVSYKNRVINGKTYWTTKGAKVYAVASGTVTKSTYKSNTYGHYVNIDHGNGLSSLYAHMDVRYVSVGDTVVQGQVIGLVGNTGNCWPRPSASNPAAGSHLHFEMRLNGNRVNPENYLPSPLT